MLLFLICLKKHFEEFKYFIQPKFFFSIIQFYFRYDWDKDQRLYNKESSL